MYSENLGRLDALGENGFLKPSRNIVASWHTQNLDVETISDKVDNSLPTLAGDNPSPVGRVPFVIKEEFHSFIVYKESSIKQASFYFYFWLDGQ
jgi:hypothetical protein